MKSAATRGLALLVAINLLNYIDRYILAAVELEIRHEFFGKNSESGRGMTGSLATAFLVSYMIAAPLMVRLCGRISRWWVIGACVILWSLASGASGLASTFLMLVATRVFVGVGEGGYGPAAPSLIADYFPIEERGRRMAFFYIALSVGSAIGYGFGGKVGALYGWRMPFYLMVIPGLLLGLMAFTQRDPRPPVDASAGGGMKDNMGKILRVPSYLYNTAAMTAMTFAIGGISFWVPSYLVEFRRLPDPGTVKLTFGAVTVVAGLLSTLLGGWVADALRQRIRGAYFFVSGVAMLASVPCLIAMLYVPFPYAWIPMFFAIFFLFFNTGPSNTALANTLPAGLRQSAFALNILLIHLLGDAVSPPVLGWITDASNYNVAFLVVAGMMAVAGLIWLAGARHLDEDTRRAGS